MIINSPPQLARGDTTGAAGAAALRTAFGDWSNIRISATAPISFAYNTDFPESGGALGLEESIVYGPVSRPQMHARRIA